MADVFEAPETITRMLFAASSLLGNLTPDQRGQAWFALDDPNRADWDFIPKPDRYGVPLSVMDRHQRDLAQVLLKSGLSMHGYSMALSIMAMENILREIGTARFGVPAADVRNPDQYFFSVFGRPSFEDSWGWRVLGHHLSLNYTIVNQRFLAVTPCNMGAQPARAGVLAPLAEDERLGFSLLHSLNAAQRAKVVIHDVAPADFVTRQVPRIGKVEYPDYWDLGIPAYVITDADRHALRFDRDRPAGVAGSALRAPQAELLMSIVESHLGRMPDEVAQHQLQRVKDDGLESLHFCWAGGLEEGTSHYYRIQGSRLLIEFDNAIDNGNHIHSMWRDYRNDFGRDLLLEHYEAEKSTGHHLQTRLNSTVPDEG